MNETEDKIQLIREKKAAEKKDNEDLSTTSKSKLPRNLLLLVFSLLLALGMLYLASITEQDIKVSHQQQVKTNAVKTVNSIKQQLLSAFNDKINKFNSIVTQAESDKNFAEPAWQEALKKQLEAQFDNTISLEIVSADYTDDEIIDNPNMGYAVLFLLNELKNTDDVSAKQKAKSDVHQANSKNIRMRIIRKLNYQGSEQIRQTANVYMVAGFSSEFITGLLTQVKAQNGYIEILQGSSVLIKKGDASLKSMPLKLAQKLQKLQWAIKYWPAEQRNKQPLEAFWLALLYLGVAALSAVAVIILLILIIVQNRQALIKLVPKKTKKTVTRKKVKSELEADSSEEEDFTDRIKEKVAASALKEPVIEAEDTTHAEYMERITDKIFKAYDIRGVVGEFINAEVFRHIGYAIGKEMAETQQNKVAIACDGRTSSPELVKALMEAMQESGIHVINVGMLTSPMLYFAAIEKADGNGIMVTASHNPANYNGMKIMLQGHAYGGELLQGLKQRVINGECQSGEAKQIKQNIVEDYIKRVSNDIKVARPMTIVIDSANSIAGKFASTLFGQLNCQVTMLNAKLDGNFPAHDPDPSRPENMAGLINKVTELGADLGIAFDGDGDRIGLVSSAGEIIWPDRILMLLAKDILSRNKNAAVLYDVKSSGKLASYISELGGEPLMCESGHSLIKERLFVTGAILAGEMSGHIFIKEKWFGFDDASYVAARVLEILSNDSRDSSEVFAELPNSLNTPEILVPTENAAAIMEKVSADSSYFEGAEIITIDGIRIEYSDGWGLVRASNTTDNLTLRLEADNEEALQRIANVLKQALLAAEPELELPF